MKEFLMKFPFDSKKDLVHWIKQYLVDKKVKKDDLEDFFKLMNNEHPLKVFELKEQFDSSYLLYVDTFYSKFQLVLEKAATGKDAYLIKQVWEI